MIEQGKPDGWLHLPTGNVFNDAGLQQHLPGWIAKWGEGVRSDFVALWRGHDALSAEAVIDAARLPAPDTLVQSHGGQIMPAMFWFALEHHDLGEIIQEHGFEGRFTGWPDFDAPDAVIALYAADPEKVLVEWTPAVPDGWQFGGKWHGEEGPVACFLRKRLEQVS